MDKIRKNGIGLHELIKKKSQDVLKFPEIFCGIL